jgi:hypothetical protein
VRCGTCSLLWQRNARKRSERASEVVGVIQRPIRLSLWLRERRTHTCCMIVSLLDAKSRRLETCDYSQIELKKHQDKADCYITRRHAPSYLLGQARQSISACGRTKWCTLQDELRGFQQTFVVLCETFPDWCQMFRGRHLPIRHR